MRRLLLPLLCLSALAHSAGPTVDVDPRDAVQGQDVRRGWFFYKDPVKPEAEPEKIEVPAMEPGKNAPPPTEKSCQSKKTWQATCGFVDPGMDMEFQALQRDKLMENMALSKNDPKAVEGVQYYMKWMNNRAIEVANAWAYNMAQNPELDPNLSAPVSQFGLKLMSEVKSAESKDIFSMLAKDSILVYFSRADCVFCVQMSSIYENLQRATGIQVWNAPLDGICIEKFKDHCVKGDKSVKAATLLQVDIVPSLFLYMKPNTWIRVANGVVTTQEIQDRIVNFTASYRKALLTGVTNGSGLRPNMDFSGDPISGMGAGVKIPNEAQINSMLSGGK